jgi:hypothetical protein
MTDLPTRIEAGEATALERLADRVEALGDMPCELPANDDHEAHARQIVARHDWLDDRASLARDLLNTTHRQRVLADALRNQAALIRAEQESEP